MAQVNFGPIGTYLISVKGKLDADGNIIEGNDFVHFIAYEDVTSGTIFTWVLDATASITDITDISEAASTNVNRLTNVITDMQREGNAKILTVDQYMNLVGSGTVFEAGFTSELYTGFETNLMEDPITSFIKTLDEISSNLPWFKDEGFLEELTAHYAENGNYDLPGEKLRPYLQKYGYSEAMVKAAESAFTDPVGNQKSLSANANAVRATVASKGGFLSENAINYAAQKVTSGQWDQTVLGQQLSAALDDYSIYPLQSGFASMLKNEGVGKIKTMEDTVKALMDKWLPPSMHKTVNVAAEAGRLRNFGNAQTELVEKFKDMKFAHYQMYDRDTPWSSIADPVYATAKAIWGVAEVDENDPIIAAIIQQNDTSTMNSMLKEEGLKRGYQTTINSFASSVAGTFGMGDVNSRGFLEGQFG